MGKISHLRSFINEEKLYMWMLVFILGFTAILFGSEPSSPKAKALKRTKEFELMEMMDQTEAKLKAKIAKIPPNKEEFARMLKEESPQFVALGVFASLGTLAIAIGLIFTIIFLGLLLAKRRILRPTIKAIQVKWDIWDVCKVAILFVFFGYIVNILEAIFVRVGILPRGMPESLMMVFNATFLDILALFFICYFVVISHKDRLRSLGLTLSNSLRCSFQGLAGYVTILPALVLLFFLVSIVCDRIGYKPPPHPLVSVFLKEERLSLILYSIILSAIIGPVVEEVFFRGFAYSAIKKKVGAGWAILISSAIFASVHMNLFGFLPVMWLGIAMAYLFEKTGSLIPSITLHIIHNSILICFVLLVRGMIA